MHVGCGICMNFLCVCVCLCVSVSAGGVFSPQTASRRPINSAPDSQAYQLMQGGTVTDVWRPALQV